LKGFRRNTTQLSLGLLPVDSLTFRFEVQRGAITTKIVVDYNRCESNARCMQVAPEIFEVRDDDKLYVLVENPPESARERVLKAIRVCPKQAISIAEGK
jgi:ferredoxin